MGAKYQVKRIFLKILFTEEERREIRKALEARMSELEHDADALYLDRFREPNNAKEYHQIMLSIRICASASLKLMSIFEMS